MRSFRLSEVLPWLARLVPRFLRQFDEWLLAYAPMLWSSRIHFVLYFTAMLCAVLGAIFLPWSIPPRALVDPQYIIGGTIPFVLAFLVIWAWLQGRHRVAQQFGHLRPVDSWQQFGLLTVGVGTIAALPLIVGLGYQWKVARSVSDAELVRDINRLNYAYHFLNELAQRHDKTFNNIFWMGASDFQRHQPEGIDDSPGGTDGLNRYGLQGFIKPDEWIPAAQKAVATSDDTPLRGLHRLIQKYTRKGWDVPPETLTGLYRRMARSDQDYVDVYNWLLIRELEERIEFILYAKGLTALFWQSPEVAEILKGWLAMVFACTLLVYVFNMAPTRQVLLALMGFSGLPLLGLLLLDLFLVGYLEWDRDRVFTHTFYLMTLCMLGGVYLVNRLGRLSRRSVLLSFGLVVGIMVLPWVFPVCCFAGTLLLDDLQLISRTQPPDWVLWAGMGMFVLLLPRIDYLLRRNMALPR